MKRQHPAPPLEGHITPPSVGEFEPVMLCICTHSSSLTHSHASKRSEDYNSRSPLNCNNPPKSFSGQYSMARMVQCVSSGVKREGLDFLPYPGELGRRIYENVSKQAWQAWLGIRRR